MCRFGYSLLQESLRHKEARLQELMKVDRREHIPNANSFDCESPLVILIDGLPGHKCYLEEDLVRDTNPLSVRHFGIDHHLCFCYHSQSMIGA